MTNNQIKVRRKETVKPRRNRIYLFAALAVIFGAGFGRVGRREFFKRAFDALVRAAGNYGAGQGAFDSRSGGR